MPNLGVEEGAVPPNHGQTNLDNEDHVEMLKPATDQLPSTLLNDGSQHPPVGNVHDIVAQLREIIDEEEISRYGDDDNSKEQHERRMKEVKDNIEEPTEFTTARIAKLEKEQHDDKIEPKPEDIEASEPSDELRQAADKGTCINAVTFSTDEKAKTIKLSSTSEFTQGEKVDSFESENDISGSPEYGWSEDDEKEKEAKSFMHKMKGLVSAKD